MVFIPIIVHSQILRERRIYYLDCSYSMVTNKLWDRVRDNLKNAIDNVSDETTELLVIPFAFDNSHHAHLNAITAKATASGKQLLKKKIDALCVSKNTMTYHSDPLNDFYSTRVNSNCVTYLFFMTDGQNEEKPNKFLPMLKTWGEKYGHKNVYGFYVMLDPAAKDVNVENIISSQSHLWKVETANVNINLIRLQSKAVFNARNDKYFDLPIYGNYNGKKFKTSFASGEKYTVTKTDLVNDKLRIYVSCCGDVHSLPISQNCKLSVAMTGGGRFDFLVTESIDVKCESKPERSLKISVR